MRDKTVVDLMIEDNENLKAKLAAQAQQVSSIKKLLDLERSRIIMLERQLKDREKASMPLALDDIRIQLTTIHDLIAGQQQRNTHETELLRHKLTEKDREIQELHKRRRDMTAEINRLRRLLSSTEKAWMATRDNCEGINHD